MRFFKAPLILTPHPGEFSALQKLISQEEAAQFQSSGIVNQVCSLAQKFGIVVALRASTTHIAFPDESCAICDGSTPGLGIAGSGDVLSGLAGGFLARWRAVPGLNEGEHGMWKDPLSAAIISAVLVHAAAGRCLFNAQGWFNPEELVRTCARISSWQLDCLKAQ
jgi:NAD(P)H-hydrate repair Nnr-like enzyme with NAD(P)H-hydrate dehydratase domain